MEKLKLGEKRSIKLTGYESACKELKGFITSTLLNANELMDGSRKFLIKTTNVLKHL